MSKPYDSVGLRSVMRSVAFLSAGVLAAPLLTGCGSTDEAGRPPARQDVARTARAQVADGGTLRWAVDALPETLNTFQADADTATTRVAQAVLPSMFRIDAQGRPKRDADYLESAKVVDTEPKQVVLYKLSQQAVWSDGREIGAADFAAQWRALSGKDSAYWTARNAGYERIEKIERGSDDLEVRVTFSRPYADWRSLFSPLYPKDVMGTPDAFNDGARRKLKVTAGPFLVQKVDTKNHQVHLARNPRWWGRPAKLSEITLTAVERDERASALAAGKIDVAEVDPATAQRVDGAAGGAAGPPAGALTGSGPAAEQALRAWARAHGLTEDTADDEDKSKSTDKSKDEDTDNDKGKESAGDDTKALAGLRKAVATFERQQKALRAVEVRRSLEPAYTQLALNGETGPLADERVRRAVARALDRKELAELVLKPLGLPAEPVGSHLALAGQDVYADNSGALGNQDAAEARALLADAGWVLGGPVKEKGEKAAGSAGKKADGSAGKKADGSAGKKAGGSAGKKAGGDSEDEDGAYVVGEDDKAPAVTGRGGTTRAAGSENARNSARGADGGHRLAQDGTQYRQAHRGGFPGAYAPKGTAAPKSSGEPTGTAVPKGTAAPAGTAGKALAKDGKALSLRFVLPSGPGSESLETVAGRITKMLAKVGIRTEITKVPDESYFKDHIASGQYDLALYSWPASAFPATDARPIYAKPQPAADGSLSVEQNYTRVGTDQVDQLFDQALATLDEGRSRSLLRKADSRIWAAAGSIPLYQRPQLTAVRKSVVNVGAFGFQTPVYEDMGFLEKSVKTPSGQAGSPSASASRK
ncbi:ABC transporter family substrate-binding protein [Streptomyces sp. NBC_00199]|uniref:ABC transporter family substrate-binding protein n=1 Tax=Streptomyces sp. NBC_00199 TaxID=2975678 RepID=UPI002250F1D5|nr:ABC transporter family substrate-binding protein [Streptomyces sp. NBC_00199]MCX5267007.1 ABC transporter family substrate-binding protein [Streptomyces sp. NBC_00199]